MTTQTPTSSDAAAGAGLAPQAGLPDEHWLSQMASAFFAVLPGASTAEPQALAGAVLHAAQPPLSPPDAASAPYPERLPVPGSSYYFLSEGLSQNRTLPAAHVTESSLAAEDRVTAQPFALPGGGQLASLLTSLSGHSAARQGAAPDTSGYYFLESAAGRPLGDFAEARRAFDVDAVRRDFPILAERVNGKPLIWLDNAATTQKPQAVIDRLAWFYAHENSNIHRAAHELAARATDAYEAARNKIAAFLGAASADEIVFVRGATEGINLIAASWGRQNIRAGDEILVSLLEHHANIVPWQQLAEETGAIIKVIPVDDSGQLLLEQYQRLLSERTKLVSVTQVSNALGTITPVKAIVDAAHAAGAKVLVDGAQAVSHLRVDVGALDADFYVFSGHKVFGPTGIGVVYGKRAILDATQPWQGGGNMIADVTFERTLYQPAPARFEAGTGNIADAVGLGAAIDYLEKLGLENVARYEHDLLAYATEQLRVVPGMRLIGTARGKTSVLSFVLDGYETSDIGEALSREGIAVRSGHHCAQPILRRFGVEATVRPSLAFYNTCAEVDCLVAVVRQLANTRTRK